MNTQLYSFNEKCYQLLSRIPEGRVTTYKEIAQALKTKAYRAVGNAMANNKTPIVIPCHRVVKSNGEIGNYALGVDKKIALLKQEGVSVENGRICDFSKRLYRFD
ncbi:MAG: methylated-DNA--[protein]-cysteine S-methyltransferase [Methylococcaceae bacterium]|nr:methylated-DNA--[protein]-cysteine S-methyltransferase [Methylococcaceae bacterium]